MNSFNLKYFCYSKFYDLSSLASCYLISFKPFFTIITLKSFKLVWEFSFHFKDTSEVYIERKERRRMRIVSTKAMKTPLRSIVGELEKLFPLSSVCLWGSWKFSLFLLWFKKIYIKTFYDCFSDCGKNPFSAVVEHGNGVGRVRWKIKNFCLLTLPIFHSQCLSFDSASEDSWECFVGFLSFMHKEWVIIVP